MRIKTFARIFPVVALLLSCTHPFGGKKIKRGVISYAITYDSTMLEKVDPRLLPSALTVSFNENRTFNAIEALSGSVSISIISDPGKQLFVTMLKVFSKKLYHAEQYEKGKYPALYSRIPRVLISTDFEEMEMLGYRCKRVTGHFVDNPGYSFDIIYTDEIAISEPNKNTPYEAINGVLLVFDLKLNNTLMHIKAQSVERKRVSRKLFEIPDDYKEVDFQTITDLIYMLQQ